MDIKKPDFMKQAITSRSHGMAFLLVIAIGLYFVGSIFGMVIQLPATMIYLFGNEEYMQMLATMDVDMERMIEIVSKQPAWMTIVSLVAQLGLILAVLLYCRFLEKRKLFTLGFQKKRWWLSYIKGIVVGAAAFSIAYGVCILTGSVTFQGKSESFSVLYLAGFFLGYVIQGMAEEVLCRGFFLVSLTKRYGVKMSVLISSLLFMIFHGMNPGMTFFSNLNLFLFGCFMALLFIRCENIWIVGALHSVWNFVQGNIFGMQVSGLDRQPSLFQTELTENMTLFHGGAFGMEGGLAATLVLLAGCGLILLDMKKRQYFVKAEPVKNPYDEAAIQKAMQQLKNSGNMFGNSMPNGNPMDQNQQPEEKNTQTPRQNMGYDGAQTPWHPKEEQKEEVYTTFDAEYFAGDTKEHTSEKTEESGGA